MIMQDALPNSATSKPGCVGPGAELGERAAAVSLKLFTPGTDEWLRRCKAAPGMDPATILLAQKCVPIIVLFPPTMTLLSNVRFARVEIHVKTPGQG